MVYFFVMAGTSVGDDIEYAKSGCKFLAKSSFPLVVKLFKVLPNRSVRLTLLRYPREKLHPGTDHYVVKLLSHNILIYDSNATSGTDLFDKIHNMDDVGFF